MRQNRIFSVAVALLVLTSCGGGNENSQSQPDSALGDNTQLATVTIDGALATTLSLRVAEVVSAVDAKPLGSSLRIPSQTGGDESLIAATDAQGRILLAAYSQETTVVLTPDTTAHALARMILGAPPSGTTEASWESRIRALSPFPALASKIGSALALGNAPDEDTQVAMILLSLVQVANADATLNASASSQSPRARAMAIRSPGVDAVPFTALSESYAGATFSVRVTDALTDGSIEVTNATPLYWALSSESQSAQKLTIRTVDDKPRVVAGTAIVDGIGYGTAILEGAENWLLKSLISSLGTGGQKVIMPGAPSEGFNLVVEQNDEAFSLNLVKTTEEVVGQFLSMLPKSVKCEKTFAKAILPDDGLLLLTRDRSVDSFKNYLKGNSIDWAKTIKDCALASEAKLVGRYISIFWKRFNAVLAAIDSINTAENGLTVFVRLNMLEKYRSTKLVFGVCQAKKSLFGINIGFTITSCAKTLDIEPFVDPVSGAPIQAPSMISLASLKLTVTAKDVNDKPTLVPSSLKFISSDPTSVAVEINEDGDALVRAVKVGQSYIIARDTATGAETFMPFTVVVPSVTASKTTLNIGDEARVRLTDSLGQTVFSAGARVIWSSSDDAKMALIPLFGTQSSPFVKAIESSTAPITIAAKQDTGMALGQISLSINSGGPTHWVLETSPPASFTPIPFGYLASVPLGWGWEPPALALGSKGLRFFFDDTSNDVVVEQLPDGGMRTVQPWGWRASAESFQIQTEIRNSQYLITNKSDPITGERLGEKVISSGLRKTVILVTNRTSSSMNGTYRVSTTSGAFLVSAVTNFDGLILTFSDGPYRHSRVT